MVAFTEEIQANMKQALDRLNCETEGGLGPSSTRSKRRARQRHGQAADPRELTVSFSRDTPDGPRRGMEAWARVGYP